MNGSSGVSIPAGTKLVSNLPTPVMQQFIPVFNYSNQSVRGLLQLFTNGELYAYSANVRSLESDIYSFSYITK